ncbi:alpha/beta hydrolase [Pseudomonas sp. 5P_3.1_Bac2]|uniref:alpha/beta hydrolase n=1 Tax=Pseudomonas sp. 5P_3.1_Bac2 TaxID=2971617 RepID=UPI0021CAB68C|nr:alpha/beta hydrolase [Pseudomonas sp. 5P_3.1_Bac2]MCU1717816.1 alpha/beta hydrolase [Pseudomonas sp. 5P_3.1_Bac2]
MSNEARSFSLTPATDKSVKTVQVTVKKAVVFFIGGAGDKEAYYFSGPFGNVANAQSSLDKELTPYRDKAEYISHYLGYNEARGNEDINTYVLKNIPTKAIPVYIVGHSLGGWNGAHLSRHLADAGYRVEMLITLDPVGEGFLVQTFSDIYWKEPQPSSKFWINIRSQPKTPDQSDKVAEFGERWIITEGPQVNAVAPNNHYDAIGLFTILLPTGKSAKQHILDSINQYLNGSTE